MGVIALVILLAAKKLIPKFPMAVVLMAVGALMTKFLPVREWGMTDIKCCADGTSAVEGGGSVCSAA